MARKGPEILDHGLWDEVTRTIKPLKSSTRPAFLSKPGQAPRVAPLQGEGFAPIPSVERRHVHTPPPLASLDRRMAQKLSRGQSEPDARIDLHGFGLEVARIRLLHFLASEQHQGSRLVLVITGKGASPYARHTLHGINMFHTPEREGRLRRDVPEWLHEAQFRAHVVGYQPAHPRHGGGGAIYVRLRRLHGDVL
jgi:DNA-nicking Smr family endonuclease